METFSSSSAKTFLRQIEKHDYAIKQKKELINELRESLGVKGTSFESDGTAKGTADPNGRSHRYTKLITLEQELEEEIALHISLKRDVLRVINSIEDIDTIKLLTCRYVLLMKPWERIAIEIGYSLRNTHRLHSKALREVSEKLARFGTSYYDKVVSWQVTQR